MQCQRLVSLTIGLTFCLSCLSCKKGPNLHDRIVAANTSQYCRMPDACFNPHVLASDRGYHVTTFIGSKPQVALVSANELGKYIQSLPMQAWPRGASITISQTDFFIDEHAVEQNFYNDEKLCRSMGLEVKVGLAG
jgi:hypothetical protein